VIEAVERVALRVELGGGSEVTASSLCERLGFDYEGQQKLIRDLSGGERRRLQLTRLLMESPNVLLLDEPTNDFDVETLAALEDLLDSFAGVLIVISHDRYFLERTCDRFVGLLGNETLRDLPRGVDEYLELRRELLNKVQVRDAKGNISSAAQERLYKKDLARIEKQLERMNNQKNSLLADQDAASFNHEELIRINLELERIESSIQELEGEWLALSERIKD
jgi:ATP-binding cassette subfamily F protein uup